MNFGPFSFRPMWMAPFSGACGRCGIVHGWNKCPADATTCFKCGKIGHFARMCYTRISRRSGTVAAISATSTATTQTIASKSTKKIRRDSERKKEFVTRRWMMSQLPFYRASDETFKVELLERFVITKLEETVNKQEDILDFFRKSCKKMNSEIETLKTKLREKINKISSLEAELGQLDSQSHNVASVSQRKDPDLRLCRDISRRAKCSRGRGSSRNPINDKNGHRYETNSLASVNSDRGASYSLRGNPKSHHFRGRRGPPNTGRV